MCSVKLLSLNQHTRAMNDHDIFHVFYKIVDDRGDKCSVTPSDLI